MTQTTAPIQLDDDGHPHRGYIHDVTAALIARGIAATDPHVEEPWNLHVKVPCTGGFAGYALLLLCWRGDELEPDTGEGWYLLPHDDPDGRGLFVFPLGSSRHATPEQVADEVAAYLLDDAPADAQATHDNTECPDCKGTGSRGWQRDCVPCEGTGELEADAQATPTAPQGGDQGDETPVRWCSAPRDLGGDGPCIVPDPCPLGECNIRSLMH